jgi:quercetin dioxygenase-like cupin family protein
MHPAGELDRSCASQASPALFRRQRQEEIAMRRGLTYLLFFSATIAAPTLLHNKTVATASEGYKSTVLALGRFDKKDVVSSYLPNLKGDGSDRLWMSLQETSGLSDVYVQSNVWAPGGSTGWHTHPGHSLIVVTAGTVTDYEGHDPECKPHVYKTGMAFIDPGGEHVHIIRDEGAVEAKTIAIQIIPAKAERRIEVADPGYCHF